MNLDQVASLDFETASQADLRKVGAARYAEDPSTRVICLAYELPDGLGVRHWQEGMLFPMDLWVWVEAVKPVSAWNALFEWNIWNKVLARRNNFAFLPKLALGQLVDTMAVAANNGLPLSLDAAAGAVPGLGVVKDKQGHSVMLRMSRPRTVAADGTLEWWDRTDPGKLDRLVEYCKQDVRVERALARVLRPMSAAECEVWQMDAEATARGVLFDADLAGRMSVIARGEALRLDARMRAVTGGAVKTTRAVGQLLDWVQVYEPKVKSLPKDQLAEWIGKLGPGPVREALEIRQEAAKSSLAKLDSMRAYASAVDGRMRGLTVYGGAFRTLRWAGRGPQVQNYARSAVKDQDALVGYIKGGGDAEGFEPFFGVTPLTGLSSALRGCLTVPKGKVMGALDFKQIEARVLPWLAGDDALLDVFRSGKDIYVTAAAGIYGIPEGLVSEAQRQTGKVSVLACGYQGGVGAFQNMAKVYGLKVSDDEADAIKVAWREANPRIVALWYAMQDAALRAMGAVGVRGGVFHAGRCAFERVGAHLQVKLPSGRSLIYRDARVEVGDFGRDVVTYMGMDQYTRQWKRISTYGGKLVENVTQAVARDLLASAMLRLRRDGIAILVSIHDEVLMELDRVEDFARAKVLMEMVPAWAVGLPIGADGYVGTRFRK